MVEESSAGGRLGAGAAFGLGFIALRLTCVIASAVLIWISLGGAPGGASFPPSGPWASLGLLVVNVLCLWGLARRNRARGITFAEALGVERGRVWRDIQAGAMCVLVLGVPFVLAIAASVFAMYGTGAPDAFRTFFLDAASLPDSTPGILLVVLMLSVVPFLATNAPVEELIYRGYGLSGVTSRWGAGIGVAVSSLLFGAQHVFFAASPAGMVVYFIAFSVWGAMAALVVRIQGRLFPVVISHWIVNAGLSIPGFAIPAMQLAGYPGLG